MTDGVVVSDQVTADGSAVVLVMLSVAYWVERTSLGFPPLDSDRSEAVSARDVIVGCGQRA
jgi:hypothetical protein